MDSQKFLSLLGMCRRAQKLSCGHDGAVGAIRSNQAKLCLLSSDSSERLRNEIKRECSYGGRNISLVILASDMYEIGHATGLKSAVLSVNDEGFAKAMLKLLNTQGEVTE
jgi:ribosomal protein L7Ae-like RNA K-turn-binding protein